MSNHLAKPNHIRFSIIIPVYNVQKYLEGCISSVLAQTYTNYEIILVNDGSTDNSLEICLNYSKECKNIIVINKPNGGLSDARNYGISLAKGEYVLFLDSDDFWIGNNILNDLEEIINQHNSPDVVLHTFRVINESTGDITRNQFNMSDLSGNYYNDFAQLQARHIYRSSSWTKLIKRTLINNESFPTGFIHEDSDYSFNLASKINTYAIYNSDFYAYRAREGSLSYYACDRNIRSLLTLVQRNLYKLYEIRLNYPGLYQGLLNYLNGELKYAKFCLDMLNNDDQQPLLPLYNKCLSLFQSYDNE